MTIKLEYEYCPNQGAPYLIADDNEKRVRHILKARCKLWTCPYCANVNKHQHYIRILNGTTTLFNEGHNVNFVTITSHKNNKTPEQCYYVYRQAWKKLSQRARREVKENTGLSFQYVQIVETHKDGRLHWHGLWSGNIKTRWLKDNCAECGFGYQAKSIQLYSPIQSTNYCVKYINKHMGQTPNAPNIRRIAYSQKFQPKPIFESDFDWSILDSKTSIVDAIQHGWRVLDYDVKLNGQDVTEILDE